MSTLSQVALVLCNGASGPEDGRAPLVLHYLPDQPGRRISIALPSFVDDLLHIPSRTLDLLEIAAYVFAADRLLSRGRSDALEYHSWSRSIDFCVRVRDFTFWNSEQVKNVLSEALQFMTGDASIRFDFEPGHCTPPANLFDEHGVTLEGIHEQPTITLFSGGIDSLAGALQCLDESDSKVLLVSHQSSASTTRTQRAIVAALNRRFTNRAVHYRFRCTLRGRRAVEETQRTRSLLYTTIGYAIASACKSDHILVYENGVTSINFHRREDLANARASRTTHPRTIRLLSRLFTLVGEAEFKIHLPYLSCTKREVIERLCERGADLLASTVSCTRTFKSLGQATHCGYCFQCIDRRIAAYAAGVQGHDHGGLYADDIVSSSIRDRAARTAAVDYVRQAKRCAEWSLAGFENEYWSDLADLLDCAPDEVGDEEQVTEVWELLRRHGEHVGDGIRNMQLDRRDSLEPLAVDSMLSLVATGEHTKPEVQRLAQSIEGILKMAIGDMFARHRPQGEVDLNEKLAALLRTHEPDLTSEHPTESFACARVVPDHQVSSANLLVEGKYIRKGTTPSKATEGIAADLTKYPEDAFVLFVVYDPEHLIHSDLRYKMDIEGKGRNRVVILR